MILDNNLKSDEYIFSVRKLFVNYWNGTITYKFVHRFLFITVAIYWAYIEYFCIEHDTSP